MLRRLAESTDWPEARRVRQPPSCADPAPSPTRGLEAPLRLAFRAPARTEPARGVAEGAERGLYLLDDPSRAVSDRGGSTIQVPLPLARLWACLRGWAPGEGLLLCFCFCVEDPKVGRARQGGRVEIGSECRMCRRRG